MPQEALNTLFLCLCIILVFLMQAGFLCLEAGAVRNKNSVNVAAKNLLDLIVVTCAYALIGYQVQYGSINSFLTGEPVISGTYLSDGMTDLFMVFQTLFAATAATIVSGAIAERCGLRTYLAISLLIATLIYPIAGSWVWGGVLETPTGWLSELGFVDFAGSAVVHSLGGSVALAAIIIIGPRRDVFTKATTFKGQNLVISLLGVLFLWIGWFGFNMGSLLTITPLLPKVFLNTFFAGCAGGVTATLWSYTYYKQANIPVIANGVLAGLVGITASAHGVTLLPSVVIGGISGLLCSLAIIALVRLRLDDPVGAIPVHLVAGLWGTVAVGIFGQPEILNTGHDRSGQIAIQALGAITLFIWSFGISYILLSVLNRYLPLRVSPEEEYQGLNIAEHGAVTELSELVNQLGEQAENNQFQPLVIDPFSELSSIASQYNRVLNRFIQSQSSLKQNIQALEDARDQLQQQKTIAEQASQHKSQFLAKMGHDIRTPINGIIGITELLQTETMTEEQKQYTDIILQSSQALLTVIDDILNVSHRESGTSPLTEQRYNLKELLKQSLALFKTETLTRPIALNLELEPDTPEHMRGDASRVRQVIITLLGNAFKFTEKGSIILRLAYDNRTGLVTIEVSDTGQGIAEERLDTLFDALQQGENSDLQPRGENTQGLPFCKQQIELMGGAISVRSTTRKGSTFFIQFPINQSPTIQ